MNTDTRVDELAGRAETMAKHWIGDVTSFVEQGDIGAAVILAVLIQLARGVLEHLPPESRTFAVQAIATHGIGVGDACKKVAS